MAMAPIPMNASAYAVAPANNQSYAAVPVGSPTQMYPPTAQPVGGRIMNVVVPNGVVPGSLLTVVTPDNITIQVSVPPGMNAGQEFKVQY
jgi:hypothetical protein